MGKRKNRSRQNLPDRACRLISCGIRFTPAREKHYHCSNACRVQAWKEAHGLRPTPLHIDKPKDPAAQNMAHKKWAKWRAAKAAENNP